MLIVEDDPDSSDLYAFAFGQAGFRVVCADTLLQGLSALRDGDVDAVVTDYHLPDGNGIAMLDVASREGILSPDIPVVLCTAGYAIGERTERFLATFLKPVDPFALVRLVQEAVAAAKDDEERASQEMAS